MAGKTRSLVQKAKAKGILLTVADAKYRDMVLGTVALTKWARKAIEAKDHDMIEIKFDVKRITATVSDSYYPNDEASNYVRINEQARKSLGIMLGEQVSVSKPEMAEAETVVIDKRIGIPRTMLVPVDWQSYVKERLLNSVVIEGEQTTVKLFGIEMDLKVLETSPSPIGRVTERTAFSFR